MSLAELLLLGLSVVLKRSSLASKWSGLRKGFENVVFCRLCSWKVYWCKLVISLAMPSSVYSWGCRGSTPSNFLMAEAVVGPMATCFAFNSIGFMCSAL